MTVLAVVHQALTSDDAQRTSSLEDVAQIVVEALVDAGHVEEPIAARCRSLYLPTAGNERWVRCTLQRRHELPHTGKTSSITTVTWTDEQAAGVLRERI